ncbi:MAG: hypothetical protein FWE07_00455 [Turicibacter sp.]|nr:hypothetical protein [Turicibacter sp.]
MRNIKINSNKMQNELAGLVTELKSLPEGTLNRRGKYYSHSVGGKDVGITHNKALIRKLCRKKYILARIKQLQHNLSSPISEFDTRLPQALIKTFSKTYQELPIAYFYHPSMAAWLAEETEQNAYPITYGYRTSYNKVLMRSKSEQIIGSLLEEYGIPYRYDALLTLNGKSKYPDFIIKNPFTGKEIIWEHFGALHQPQYEAAMHEKMNLYSQHGYKPEETIIFTFEIDIITEHRLQSLIENIIL